MGTLTTNLGLDKPTPGDVADRNLWGGYVNTNFDKLDAIFAPGGTGTSVGLNIGAGNTLAVAGTLSVSGTITAPTQATADNSTKVATTAFVKSQSYATTSALASYAPLASPALTGAPTAPTAAPGTNTTQLSTTAFVNTAVAAAIALRGYLAGLITSNNVTTPNSKIDVAAGVCTDDGHAVLISYAGGTLDCGATGANGLDTGTLAASTWYHLFVIAQAAGASPAVFASTSLTPTLPGSYTLKRRVGSFKTDTSAHIQAYVQVGDRFIWKTGQVDLNGTTLTTNGNSVVTMPSVPPGFSVEALFLLNYRGGGGGIAYVYSGLQTAVSNLPSSNCGQIINASGGDFMMETDTAQHIQVWTTMTGSPSAPWYLVVRGWIDRRGRDD